jgi:hypothetical protein
MMYAAQNPEKAQQAAQTAQNVNEGVETAGGSKVVAGAAAVGLVGKRILIRLLLDSHGVLLSPSWCRVKWAHSRVGARWFVLLSALDCIPWG